MNENNDFMIWFKESYEVLFWRGFWLLGYVYDKWWVFYYFYFSSLILCFYSFVGGFVWLMNEFILYD